MKQLFVFLLLFGLLLPVRAQTYEPFDLLEQQMELRVLDILQKRGYYITGERLDELRNRELQLTRELSRHSHLELEKMADWADEQQEVEEAEDQAILKMVDKFARQIVKAAARQKKGEVDEGVVRSWRQDQLQKIDDKLKRKKKASELADYLITLGSEHNQKSLVRTFTQQTKEQLYRGAIKDKVALVKGLRDLELQRLELEACVATLDSVMTNLKRLETAEEVAGYVEDPSGAITSALQSQVHGYLVKRYPESDPEQLKEALGKTTEIAKNMYSLKEELRALQSNRGLRDHPEALRTATSFLVLGTVCKDVLGMVREVPGSDAMGPLLDTLEYYSETLLLVPSVAAHLESTFDTFRQGLLGQSLLDAWAPLANRSSSEAPLRKSALMEYYEIPIAAAIGLEFPYYLRNDSSFIGLTQEQYQRLESALSNERILNADTDVSSYYRTDFDFNLLWNSDRNVPLSKFAGDSYKERLSEVAREPLPIFTWKGAVDKTPSPERVKKFLRLANGERVKIGKKQWNASELEEAADEHLTRLADEMIVRTALGTLPRGGYGEWVAFRDLVEGSGVIFSPGQLLRLFNNYYRTEPKGKLLRPYLEKEKARRAAASVGLPSVGVPLVHDSLTVEADEDGGASLETTIVVDSLPPGQSVPAEVRWKTSTGQTVLRQTVELRNGALELQQPLQLPGESEDREEVLQAEAEVAIKMPPEVESYLEFQGASDIEGASVRARHLETFDLKLLSEEKLALKKVSEILKGFRFNGEFASEVRIQKVTYGNSTLFVNGGIFTPGASVPAAGPRGLKTDLRGQPLPMCIGVSWFKIALKIHPSSEDCREASNIAVQAIDELQAEPQGRIRPAKSAYPYLPIGKAPYRWSLKSPNSAPNLGHTSGAWKGYSNEDTYQSFAYGCLFQGRYDFSIALSNLYFNNNRHSSGFGPGRGALTKFEGKSYVPLLSPEEATRATSELVSRAASTLE